jgi:hypothetical protein
LRQLAQRHPSPKRLIRPSSALVAGAVLQHKMVGGNHHTIQTRDLKVTRMAKKYTAQCTCGAVKFEIAPKLEMFTKRRLKWNKPLDLPQFESMPG